MRILNKSLFTGLNYDIGNFHQIFNRNGYAFHAEIAKKFGSAIRLHGFFGVRVLWCIRFKHFAMD